MRCTVSPLLIHISVACLVGWCVKALDVWRRLALWFWSPHKRIKDRRHAGREGEMRTGEP